jgi:uncharacterized protein YecT (DUF1311 family)
MWLGKEIVMFRIAMRLFACLAGFAASAQLANAQEVRCNPAGTTMEMASCAANRFEKADRAMNIVYSKLMRKAQTMDKSATPGDTDKAVDRLRNAQRAWVVWRDAECPLRTLSYKGGSMERIERPSCAANLTEERTKLLEDVLKETE